MICPRCGTQLPDTVTICFNCKTTFQNNNNQMNYFPQNQQLNAADPRNNPIMQNNPYLQQNMQQGLGGMNNQQTRFNGQVPNQNKMPKKTKILIGVAVFVLLCIIAGAGKKRNGNDTPSRNSASATTESKTTEAVTEDKNREKKTTEKVTEAKTEKEEIRTETEEASDQNTEEVTEEKAEAEDKRPDDEISSEFKEYMDSYEAFMNEYCEFLEKYNADSTNSELMAEYSEFLLKYNDFNEKIDEYNKNQSTMTTAETNYYLEVMNRVNTKLIKVTQEMNTSGN